MHIRQLGATACAVALAGGALGGTALASPQSASQADHQARQAKKKPTHITVTATEFHFKLSKTSVKKGTTVIFKLVNKGVVAHDFDFTKLHKKTKIIASKKTATLTVKFTKKGKFKYICSVPRHAEQGMTGFFKVT
jgi:uncharacterized cupredoxin-like copper-binding protein